MLITGGRGRRSRGGGGMSKPIVVKPKSIIVDKQTYNTIRSFVESSVKPVYAFNVGICIDSGAVFEKRGKWRLVITPRKVVLHNKRVSIHVYSNSSCIEFDFGEQKLCVREDELKEYGIVPDTEIPYAKPISLHDFVEKLLLYYEAAQDCW
jgi:hypothetical protein